MHNRKLPEKEDNTYFMLPRPGEPPQQGAQVDAWQMVAGINPAYLEFTRTGRLSYRAFGVLFGLWVGAMFLLMFAPSLLGLEKVSDKANPLALLVADGVPVMFILCGFFLAYSQLRVPQFRVILSKRLRRFYVWHGKAAGWVTIDYDKCVPAVRRHTSVSPYGASTVYILDVYELQPGKRLSSKGTGLSDPTNRIIAQAELWEFIRAYMDGPADKVPAIKHRIPEGQSHGIHARMDGDLFAGLLDKEHRLRPGLFYKLYFGMNAMTGYWADRLLPWLERHAPNPPWPAELAKAMEWDGENPYRMNPPTEVEQQAIDGQLPYMNRRWFIGMVLSTLLWGGSLLGMGLIGWQEILFG